MEGQLPRLQLQHGQGQLADRSCTRAGEFGFNDVSKDAQLMSISRSEIDNSQPIGSCVKTVTTVADVAVTHAVNMVDVEVKSEVSVMDVNIGKRRRGRPPRSQEKTAMLPRQPQQKANEDEEDVCFICFDGGSLVLCDRRGCPKAYHPACIKRDESFFQSKAKWNCGWHICSSCQKASHYMCYTCTYSLCKRCIKDADYVCVRENKGFCGICMRTIMLIENIASGNQEQVQVDFDDRTSWEYLFKVYWTCLKEKLSLTIDELTEAKNPWKEEELPKTKTIWGRTGYSWPKRDFSGQLHHSNMKDFSENCSSQFVTNDFKKRKTDSQLKDLNKSDSQMITDDDRMCKTHETDEIGPILNTNLDEHAAFDVHNIKLLYLKRKLIEDLMDDAENFHEKVVGSFVRIRVSGADHEQDLHRLVQVIGTSKVSESYRVGARTTNTMLEILNLNKEEVIPIDSISNEEFTEEECKHLQQSVRCGLFKRLTVGEIVKKVRILQPVKNLDAGMSQLNFPICANEKGRQREFRECAEKLERLKSSTGHQCQLRGVHVDPIRSSDSKADAGNSDKKEQGNHLKLRNSLNGRDGTALPGAGNQNRKELLQPVNSSCTVPGVVLALSAGKHSVRGPETEKIWHYQDPSGKIQGPFSKLQLRTWSNKGLFPLDLRIWSIFDKQEASVRLTDALSGRSRKAPPRSCSSRLPNVDIAFSSNDSGLSHNNEVSWLKNNKAGRTWGSARNDAGHFNSSDESLRSNECSHSSSWTPPMDASVTRDEQAQSSLKPSDIAKGTKSLVDRSEIYGPLPSPSSSVQLRKESQQSDNPGLGEINVNACSLKIRKGDENQGNSRLCGWDSCSGMSGTKSIEKLEQKRGVDLSNQLSETATHSQKDFEGQAIENKQSVSSNALVNDSGPNWSPASSFEVAKALLDLLSDAGRNSRNDAKPSAKEWDSNTISTSSPKLTEGGSDHAPTPTSGNDHLTPSSPTHPPKLRDGGSDHAPTPTSGNNNLTQGASDHALTPTSGNDHRALTPTSGNDHRAPTPTSGNEHLTPGAGDLAPTPTSGNDHFRPGASDHALIPTSGNDHHVPTPTSGNEHSAPGAGDHASTPTSGNNHLTPLPTHHPECREGDSDHAPTHTSVKDHLAPSSPRQPTMDLLDLLGGPLVEESVSGLLAEVEAMESMGGLPSPTSKMSCPLDFMDDSDFDCFDPLEGFFSAPDSRKSEVMSFTENVLMLPQSTASEGPLQLSNMNPSQSIVTQESLGIPQVSTQLAITNKPLQESNVSSESAVTGEHALSSMPSQSSLTTELPGLSHADIHNHQKYFSGHSSVSTVMERNAKPNDTLAGTWKDGSETQPSSSTVGHGNVQPFTPSSAVPWAAMSNIQLPASSASGVSCGTVKENANLSQGVRQVNTNMGWEAVGEAQQHTTTNAVNWNSGGWGNQPREFLNRYSGPRDNCNSFLGRDSSVGRERFLMNGHPYHGAGNGGSYRTPPKGQRVCKFYESGYCKKGASCSYWHP